MVWQTRHTLTLTPYLTMNLTVNHYAITIKKKWKLEVNISNRWLYLFVTSRTSPQSFQACKGMFVRLKKNTFLIIMVIPRDTGLSRCDHTLKNKSKPAAIIQDCVTLSPMQSNCG